MIRASNSISTDDFGGRLHHAVAGLVITSNPWISYVVLWRFNFQTHDLGFPLSAFVVDVCVMDYGSSGTLLL